MPNALVNGAAPSGNPVASAPAAGAPGAPPAAAQKSVEYTEVRDMLGKQMRIAGQLKELLDDGNVNKKEVMNMATDLVAERVVSAEVMAGFLVDLPDDPNEVRKWAEKHSADADRTVEGLLDMIDGIAASGPGMETEEAMGGQEAGPGFPKMGTLSEMLQNGRG